VRYNFGGSYMCRGGRTFNPTETTNPFLSLTSSDENGLARHTETEQCGERRRAENPTLSPSVESDLRDESK